MKDKILLFDNYDSFTYNLYHIVRSLGVEVEVRRNDQITLDEVDDYNRIILSPGPGIPLESGILLPLLHRYSPTKNIMGVCLGMQAIGEVFGGTLRNLDEVKHGIQTPVRILHDDVFFQGIEGEVLVGRYHSWVVARQGLPSCLEVTAEDSEGQIMALRHKDYNVRGIQFHPESILTPQGTLMIQNWLNS